MKKLISGNLSGGGSFTPDDNCAICQAMRKATKEGRNLSESELKEAFQQAKEEGGIVGGSF